MPTTETDPLVISISLYSRGKSSTPTPDDPATKSESHYREAGTGPVPSKALGETGLADRIPACGNCTHFHSNRCDIVTGHIEAQMVCDYWGPRDRDIQSGHPLED